MKRLILISFVFLSTTMFGVLSPFYQSSKEIETIINDPKLSDEIGQEAILEIKKVEDGYLIFTSKYFIKANIEYIPTNLMGPVHFEVHFDEKIDI
ncbi:MAG: hypothetical protein K1060chlam5_00193 [Candidatus Anoxychlamydiales bacterium]|nr:hypothetical protein [Candidatus Anoxychlamydiales bacterium]